MTRSPLKALSTEENQVSQEDQQKWFGFCTGMVTHFGCPSGKSAAKGKESTAISLMQHKKSKTAVYPVTHDGVNHDGHRPGVQAD